MMGVSSYTSFHLPGSSNMHSGIANKRVSRRIHLHSNHTMDNLERQGQKRLCSYVLCLHLLLLLSLSFLSVQFQSLVRCGVEQRWLPMRMMCCLCQSCCLSLFMRYRLLYCYLSLITITSVNRSIDQIYRPVDGRMNTQKMLFYIGRY